MTLGSLVRGITWGATVALLVSVAAAHFLGIWLQNRQPCAIRIESGLPEPTRLVIGGAFANTASASRRMPSFHFEGVPDSGEVVIAPGEVREIPVRVEIERWWLGLPVARGRLHANIEILAQDDSCDVQESVRASVYVAGLATTYRWVVYVIAAWAVAMSLCLLLSLGLSRPSGHLESLPLPEDTECASLWGDTVAASMPASSDKGVVYDLENRRYHNHLAFWRRDLIFVNTRWRPWCPRANLRVRDFPGAFCLQFTGLGAIVSALTQPVEVWQMEGVLGIRKRTVLTAAEYYRRRKAMKKEPNGGGDEEECAQQRRDDFEDIADVHILLEGDLIVAGSTALRYKMQTLDTE